MESLVAALISVTGDYAMCKQCNYHWIWNENDLYIKITHDLYINLNHLHRNFSHYKKSQIYTTDQQTVNSAFCSPSPFHTSSTNFVNQKFNDSAVMLTMFVSRLWILSHSTWNPSSSFTASLFGLAFCHCVKIFKKDHFVTYRVDFGMHFSKNSFSSSPVFNSLNFLLGGIFNQPSWPSTTRNEDQRKKACF